MALRPPPQPVTHALASPLRRGCAGSAAVAVDVGVVLAVAWAGDRSARAARAAIARLDCAGFLACGVVEVGLDRRWGAPEAACDLSDGELLAVAEVACERGRAAAL